MVEEQSKKDIKELQEKHAESEALINTIKKENTLNKGRIANLAAANERIIKENEKLAEKNKSLETEITSQKNVLEALQKSVTDRFAQEEEQKNDIKKL